MKMLDSYLKLLDFSNLLYLDESISLKIKQKYQIVG